MRIFCDAGASMDTVPKSFTPRHRNLSCIEANLGSIPNDLTPRCTNHLPEDITLHN